jgi:hypothetical protein
MAETPLEKRMAAHKKKTQPQSCRMGDGAQVEVSDVADQYVSDDAPDVLEFILT